MPQWKPAGIPGKGPVASIVTVSIPFMWLAVATGDLQVIDEVYVDEGEESAAFVVVDEEPQYPGGMDALYAFLKENIRYPQQARDNGITGKVYVTFVVEKDGSISNPRLLRDIGGGCGAEAIRVVRMMPRWIPGKLRGETVRVQFNLPVKFTLSDE